ncbi:hypothetical protein A5780_08720 [Nocardia sp. 852002-20019_SCH5090214]|nr:hypothetical protein A5780_08720 [Nocardia sp. 852002-20019_SCH5090214]
MTASIVWVLWPASVFFTAVLSYRAGAYWSSRESVGRHWAGVVPSDDPWDEELADDEIGVEGGSDPMPAPDQAPRWWRDEDDTEVLPRLQDIRPPIRATPIRRPRWIDGDTS